MTRVKEHPRSGKINGVIKEIADDLATVWDERVFRCVDLAWARPEYLISGEGSRQNGSRWMRPLVERAVYASASEIIALKESRGTIAYYGIREPRRNPRVSVEIEATLQRVADLRRLKRLVNWPDLKRLLAESWEKSNASGVETFSQAVGRTVAAQGFEGLIVPSARDRRGRNLIWFPDRLRTGSMLRISGEHRLTTWLQDHP